MTTQMKLLKQNNSARPAMDLDQLAADRAWLAKCVADRQGARLACASTHVHRASLLGLAAHAS